MTKIKDIFPNIFTGVNIKSYASSNGKQYKVFNKDAMLYSTFNITKFTDYISDSVSEKYVMQERDVIISLKNHLLPQRYTIQ